MLIQSTIERNSQVKMNCKDVAELYQHLEDKKWEQILQKLKLLSARKEIRSKTCCKRLKLLRQAKVVMLNTKDQWITREAKAIQFSTHSLLTQRKILVKHLPVECLELESHKTGRLHQWMVLISIKLLPLKNGVRTEVISAKRNFYQEHLIEEWTKEIHSLRLTHCMSMFQSHVKFLHTHI